MGDVSSADLKIYQGSDYRASVHVYNDDGTDADLTGCTAQAQIRRDVADKCPEVAAEIECTIQSPLIDLFVPRTATTELCGRYLWDLDLIDATGGNAPLIGGKVIVTQEVTREIVMTAAT